LHSAPFAIYLFSPDYVARLAIVYPAVAIARHWVGRGVETTRTTHAGQSDIECYSILVQIVYLLLMRWKRAPDPRVPTVMVRRLIGVRN
jgi:hypothetical protein